MHQNRHTCISNNRYACSGGGFMLGSYTVALVGFAQNESATFESFFRLAARRPPGYVVQDEVIDAQILIVNADNPQALHLVQHAGLPGRVLLVGNSDGGTGWPLQRKPVKLVAVLAELDAIVGVNRAPAPKLRSAPPAFAATEPYRPAQVKALEAVMRRPGSSGAQYASTVPPTRPAEQVFAATEPFAGTRPPRMAPAVTPRRRAKDSEFPPTRPMVRADTVPATWPARSLPPAPAPVPAASSADGTRAGVMGVTDFGALDELPLPSARPGAATRRRSADAPSSRLSQGRAPAVPEVERGDVLLVAESLVEGRILHKRFKKYGLSIDWSREPSQAVVMLKSHPYRLVVIDRLSGEPDAYHICRAAKQQKRAGGGAPVVIMFAAVAGSMDRMKAGLAGSDAYLSRSATESDLYKVLAQHRLVDLDGFAKTNVGF